MYRYRGFSLGLALEFPVELMVVLGSLIPPVLFALDASDGDFTMRLTLLDWPFSIIWAGLMVLSGAATLHGLLTDRAASVVGGIRLAVIAWAAYFALVFGTTPPGAPTPVLPWAGIVVILVFFGYSCRVESRLRTRHRLLKSTAEVKG